MQEFQILFKKTNSFSKKLRPFSSKFRIQFGQKLRKIGRVRQTWVNYFYLKKNPGYMKKPSKAKYRFLLVRPTLVFYRLAFLRYSFIKLSKNFLFRNKKFLDYKNLLVTTTGLLKKNVKKYSYRGQQAYKFRKLKKVMELKKIRVNKRLMGNLHLVNTWMPLFHKFNLKRLSSTVKKNISLSINNFLNFWKNYLLKEKYSLYSWYSFYVFRLVFSKVKSLSSLYASPSTKKLLILISYKKITFLMYLVKNYFIFSRNLLFGLYSLRKAKPFFFLDLTRSKSSLFYTKVKNPFECKLFTKQNLSKKKVLTKTFFLDKFCLVKSSTIYSLYFYLDLLLKKNKVFTTKNVLNSDLINKTLCFFFELSKLSGELVSLKVLTLIKLRLQLLENKSYIKQMVSGFVKQFSREKRCFNTLKKQETFEVFFEEKKPSKDNDKTFYLVHFYSWLFFKYNFNRVLYKKLFKPYNIWLFFINYTLNYYIFSKLYFVFLNYFFCILCQKFMKLALILRLKRFELCYDFIKFKDNSRYYLGLKPQAFITTFNRRVKKGFL